MFTEPLKNQTRMINANFLPKTVILHGKSENGKHRIKQNGDQWTVQFSKLMQNAAAEDNGIWLYLTNNNASLFIMAENDADYTIVQESSSS